MAVVPDDHFARSTHGLILLKAERYEEALDALERAIALQPACSCAYINRGRVFSALGQNKQALLEYDEALEVEPLAVAAMLVVGPDRVDPPVSLVKVEVEVEPLL